MSWSAPAHEALAASVELRAGSPVEKLLHFAAEGNLFGVTLALRDHAYTASTMLDAVLVAAAADSMRYKTRERIMNVLLDSFVGRVERTTPDEIQDLREHDLVEQGATELNFDLTKSIPDYNLFQSGAVGLVLMLETEGHYTAARIASNALRALIAGEDVSSSVLM